jgi:hypothetical protein
MKNFAGETSVNFAIPSNSLSLLSEFSKKPFGWIA